MSYRIDETDKKIYIFTTLTIQCPLPAKILHINIYYRLKYSNKTFESIRRLYAAKPVQILHERRFWGLETSIVYRLLNLFGTRSLSTRARIRSDGGKRRQQNRCSESQTARVPLLSYLMNFKFLPGKAEDSSSAPRAREND